MASSQRARVTHIVPDASLVAKWHTPEEAGWEHATSYIRALGAGSLRLTAPEHLKVETIRVLQLGVRDRRYAAAEGWLRIEALLALPVRYVRNDLLFAGAFRLASDLQMALDDALYVALADVLGVPFVTADRRLHHLAQQRSLGTVAWFEDLTPPAEKSST